jgi:dTMP kinase
VGHLRKKVKGEKDEMLIAFEGLDQSGKETQARSLRRRLEEAGRRVHALSFPEYDTPIGAEIAKALHGEREFGADVMQLLYVANRMEFRPRLDVWLGQGDVVICDRYRASSVAYGEAHGLDPLWLTDIQRYLPEAAVTVLLDIAPGIAAARKATGRDRYERDLTLLGRVRESYRRQASQAGWMLIDGERPAHQVSEAVEQAVLPRLGLQ